MSGRLERLSRGLTRAVSVGLLALSCTTPTVTNNPTPTGTPKAIGETASWPEEPYRATRPALGPVRPANAPEVQQFTLQNGLEVFLLEQRRLPTVDLGLEFELGATGDHFAKPGEVAVCMDLLDEGTRKLDKVAWEARQADHAVLEA